MSTVHGGQGNIVRNGLVLWLDAANPRSYDYPYNGTTWRDLSGNGNNGTLTNGPTYSTLNGGSIVFDGIDDYVTTPYVIQPAISSTLQSFCSWLKGTTLNNSFFGSDANSTGKFHLILDYPTPTQLRFAESYYGSGSPGDQNNIVSVSPNSTWNYGCIVKTGVSTFDVYLNGVKVISNANKTANGSSLLNLGRWWSGFNKTSNIGHLLTYNRALSQQEIQQNYNSTKSRFGI